MKKQSSLIATIVVLFAALLASCTNPGKPGRAADGTAKNAPRVELPNIIFILADDMGYADVGNFGSSIKTPNLDQLASEGMKLTSFYVMPNCSPSRAAILTGRYPLRVGMPLVLGPKGPAWTAERHMLGLNPKEETVAELLQEKGYKTALFGKWHLGHHPEHLPLNHGFDEFYGLPYSNDQWPYKDTSYPPLTMIKDTIAVDTLRTLEDQALLTEIYTEKALDFIERHQVSPFFLFLSHSMPHVPINASKRFSSTSEEDLYEDVVRELDWSVGRVMKVLDSLDLTENTLVVFTSDNGPWLMYGDHAGSAQPFREGKQTTFEGGVRVPFIARWPGTISANTISGAISGGIDLLPTFVEISGAQLPAVPIDGISLLPLLSGQESSVKDTHYFFRDYQLEAVRKGRWKLHLPHDYESVRLAGNDGKRGEVIYKQQPLALFDLTKDPGESINLVNEHPQKVAELKQLAKEFEKEINENKREPHRASLQ